MNYCFASILVGLPNVYVRPSSAVLPSSSETRLVCESRDTPSFDSIAYWTHAGQRVELNPSIIEMHGNELRIFQFGDTAYTQPGAYACVVSTRYGLMESEPALLSLPSKWLSFLLFVLIDSDRLLIEVRCQWFIDCLV